jgi:chromosome segregation ATPase
MKSATASSLTSKAVNDKVDEMRAEMEVTSEQLKSLSTEKDAALRRIKVLESPLAGATKDYDAIRSERDASNAKVVELAAAVNGLETNAGETSLEIKFLSAEKDAALAEMTDLKSKLRDTCQGLEVAQWVLEASNTKIDVLVTEQGELQSQNEALAIQLYDKTQELELARSEFEFESGAACVAELTATVENLKSSAEETSTKLDALSGEKEASICRKSK